MRFARLASFIVLFALCVIFPLSAKSKKLTVMGKLTRVMAIGAESTGWAIELNPVITLDGRQISSLEIQSSDTPKLESLKDHSVEAKGTLTYVSGTEVSPHPVLQLSSIKALKQK